MNRRHQRPSFVKGGFDENAQDIFHYCNRLEIVSFVNGFTQTMMISWQSYFSMSFCVQNLRCAKIQHCPDLEESSSIFFFLFRGLSLLDTCKRNEQTRDEYPLNQYKSNLNY